MAYLDELQYLEAEARADMEAEIATWPKCEEGHAIHPDALYCEVCRDLTVAWSELKRIAVAAKARIDGERQAAA